MIVPVVKPAVKPLVMGTRRNPVRVTITSPADGSAYLVNDTIPLTVDVENTDATSVDYVIERVQV